MRDRTRAALNGEAPETPASLPYRVELWSEGGRIERVLARAVNARLARLVFRAAREEYPGRRVTLRRGARLIADTENIK